MADVRVEMLNGEVHEFKDRGRSGGSYTVTIRQEGGFVIITDEWYHETAFPANTIKSVHTTQSNRY